jgi:hypothetical protein
MAEVQTSTQTGELSQRFIEFVMMHAQNAALFLGQIPNPKTGEGEVNLELAKMFIDQLEMIHEKTRGNLTSDETTVLRNTLSNLQMAYVEAAQKASGRAETGAPPPPQQESPAPTQVPAANESASNASPESESKKKFTKSYGS